MKVFVLGGYGKTGLPAVEALNQIDQITEIAIAGRNLDKAKLATEKIGAKAVAVLADGTNGEELTTLSAEYDILINAAGNEAVLPGIYSAIHNKSHYCDMAWGPIVEKAQKLDSVAKAAGISAIIATGISPCISNLMAVYVAEQLDEVEQVQLGRADVFEFDTGQELTAQQWLKDPHENLNVLPKFRPFFEWVFATQKELGSQKIVDFKNGQWVDIDPVVNGICIPQVDGGLTSIFPYACTNDFLGMLPKDIGKKIPMAIWFSSLPPQLHDVLRGQVLKMLESDLDPKTILNEFFEIIESDPDRWLTLPEGFVPVPKIWARALGRKEGRAARVNAWFAPEMWKVGGYPLTSIALVAAVRKIFNGEVKIKGVLPAEKVFAPKSFFVEVNKLLPEPANGVEMINESFEWLE